MPENELSHSVKFCLIYSSFYKKIWFLEVPLVPEVSRSADP